MFVVAERDIDLREPTVGVTNYAAAPERLTTMIAARNYAKSVPRRPSLPGALDEPQTTPSALR